MKRHTVAFVSLAGMILGSACHAIVGIEDRVEAPPSGDAQDAMPSSDTTITDAGAAQDGGSGGPCAADANSCNDPDAAPPAGCPTDCLPPAPAGWTGPSATYDGPTSEKPTDCPATYTNKDLDTHVGMTAAAATCGCGTAYPRCESDVSVFSQSGCGGTMTLDGTASSAGCYKTKVSGASIRLEAAKLATTCFVLTNTPTVPPPTYAKEQVACSAPDAGACTGRADCVAAPAPAQPFTRLCIHKDGDVPCPSLDYAARFVANKTVADTRGCTTCTATATGGTCGTKWDTSSSLLICNSAAQTGRTVGTCYAYSGANTLVNTGGFGPVNGTCTAPAGGQPTGTATSAEPVTFCCNK